MTPPANLVILRLVKLPAGLHRAWCAMGLTFFLADAAWSTPARVTLSSEGPASCPDAKELARGLESSLKETRVEATDPDANAPAIVLRFTEGPDGTSAHIQIWQGGALAHERTLTVDNCREAALAATFVAAVFLDPSQSPASDSGEGKEPTESPSSPESAESTREAPPLAPDQVTEVRRNDRRSQPSRRGRTSARSDGPTVFLGAAVTSDLGPAPELLLGPALTGGLAPTKSSIWAPHAEFQVGYQWGDTSVQPAGDAWFDLALLSLRFCPSQLVAGRLRLNACLSARGGWMWARAGRTAQPGSVLRPWMDVGPGLGGSIGLSKRLRFSAYVGLGFPLVRDQFQFDSSIFHATGVAVGTASLGLTMDIF